MSKLLPLLFFSLPLVLDACSTSSAEAKYNQIKNSGLSGEPLFTALSEFELQYMNHFSSKVDLGGYFLLTGNIERAKDYFRRAEMLASKAPRTAETRENTAILYGSLARIALLEGDHDKAMNFVEKAISADPEAGKPFRLLKAHILLAQNEHEQSLALFEELYDAQKDLMQPDDIQAFMYLLAKVEKPVDCAFIVDWYFEKGPYFAGLGFFASSAYEAAGQPNKAILAAFLDYEYYSGYTITDDSDFLKNLDTLEKQLDLQSKLPETAQTLRLVRSLYHNSNGIDDKNHSGFFVEDYIILKKKIHTQSLSSSDFSQYLRLERYFSRFPVYYWNIWQTVSQSSPAVLVNYLPVLEKIISLDKNGRYAQPAWEEMTKLLGYNK